MRPGASCSSSTRCVSASVSTGRRELHDRHRRTRSGKGTHARVMHGLQQLREHDIAFHAIAVVTRDTLAQADAFFDFFLDHGIHDVGCNFDEAEGGHTRSSLAGSEAAHAAFLEQLMQRSIASDGRVVVRELASAWQLVAQPLPQYAWRGRHWPDNAQVMPLALISVAWNGDFCTFSPELLGQRSVEFGDFVLGNVADGGYVDGAAIPDAMQRLWSAVAAGVEACERALCLLRLLRRRRAGQQVVRERRPREHRNAVLPQHGAAARSIPCSAASNTSATRRQRRACAT